MTIAENNKRQLDVQPGTDNKNKTLALIDFYR